MRHSERGKKERKKKRFQCCADAFPIESILSWFLMQVSYNDTAVGVTYNEAAAVLSITLLNTICFPKPLNVTWDLTVIHTK